MRNLFREVQRIAAEHPETRQYLVPELRKYAARMACTCPEGIGHKASDYRMADDDDDEGLMAREWGRAIHRNIIDDTPTIGKPTGTKGDPGGSYGEYDTHEKSPPAGADGSPQRKKYNEWYRKNVCPKKDGCGAPWLKKKTTKKAAAGSKAEQDKMWAKGYRYMIQWSPSSEMKNKDPIYAKTPDQAAKLIREDFPDEKGWKAVRLTEPGGKTASTEMSAPPFPKGAHPDKWSALADNVAKSVALLDRVVSFVKYDPNNFHGYALFKGSIGDFELSVSELLDPSVVQVLTRRWRDVEDLVKEYVKQKNPFYANLSGSVKSIFGSSKASNLVFSIVVEVVRKKGTRWHS